MFKKIVIFQYVFSLFANFPFGCTLSRRRYSNLIVLQFFLALERKFY